MTHPKTFMRATLTAVALLGTAIWAAPAAQAYEVAPLHHYLELTGKKATSSLVIDNTHDYPLTVEISIAKRTYTNGAQGEDVPADDDFLIFPPQAIVAPGKKQRVQLRYVGDPVDQSEFYRLLVRQIPIDLDQDGSNQVKLTYNFTSIVYVAPSGAKAKVVADGIAPAPGGGHTVTLRNEGTYHALLPSLVWTASDGSDTRTLETSRVPLGDLRFLEPGGVQTITLPAEALDGLPRLASLSLSEETSRRSR